MEGIHILLVEDNEGDIFLTKEAFEERKIVAKISVVKNGGDALDFIFMRGAYAEVKKPDLILLDINIPVLNGHEVLRQIKSNEDTRTIPVIMLTTSSSQKDVTLAYQNYANSFITKPIEMEDFMNAITKIEDFWFQLVKLSK